MLKSKRGQGATEYLVILAVILIIALIVILVLGGVPGIGSNAKVQSNKAYWQNAEIAIASYAMSVGGSDTIIVRNNVGTPVRVNSFVVNGVELAGSGFVLGIGASKSLSGAVVSNTTCNAGESFSVAVSGNYTDLKTSAVYLVNPAGFKLEGTCAA